METIKVPLLKEALRAGEVVMGPFFRMPAPALVEIFGYAGFDLIVIDLEHGPLNIQTAEDLVRSCQLVGMASVIRVSYNAPHRIQRALDIGAQGVQIPQVATASEAERAVRAAKFAPRGMRGVCRFVRAAKYSATDRSDYFPASNRDTAIILHIEGKEGIENLTDIVEVEGIDVIYLGPYDLSQSLGVPGQVESPVVVEKMREAVSLCRQAGVAVGTFADDVGAARKWVEAGIQYVNVGIDASIIYNSCQEMVEEFRRLLE